MRNIIMRKGVYTVVQIYDDDWKATYAVFSDNEDEVVFAGRETLDEVLEDLDAHIRGGWEEVYRVFNKRELRK